VYTYRNEQGQVVIRFEPEIPWQEKGSKDATLAFMTQQFISKLEEIIIRYPEQWMWVHKIWKNYEYKGRTVHLKDRWEPVLNELGFYDT
jgi:KDO2-lipid IV(A) lauroyltransferase